MPGRACRCTASVSMLVARDRMPGAGRRGPAPPTAHEFLNHDTRSSIPRFQPHRFVASRGGTAVGSTNMSARLLEREAEVAVVSALASEVLSADSSIVVIEGPAGIGKTALLEAAREAAADLNVCLAQARASELDR